MDVPKFSTSILTDDVSGTSRFYQQHFGFEEVLDIGWFATIRRDGVHEMCFWDRAHDSLPEGYSAAPAGVVLAFMVDDVDAVEQRLRAAGVPIVQPVRDEPWGQRHVFCTDPAGTLIDVVQPIAPAPEWLRQHGLDPQPAQ